MKHTLASDGEMINNEIVESCYLLLYPVILSS